MKKILMILALFIGLLMPIAAVGEEPPTERFDWRSLVSGLKLEIDDGSLKLGYGNKPEPRVEEPGSNRTAVYGGLLFLIGMAAGVYAAGRFQKRSKPR